MRRPILLALLAAVTAMLPSAAFAAVEADDTADKAKVFYYSTPKMQMRAEETARPNIDAVRTTLTDDEKRLVFLVDLDAPAPGLDRGLDRINRLVFNFGIKVCREKQSYDCSGLYRSEFGPTDPRGAMPGVRASSDGGMKSSACKGSTYRLLSDPARIRIEMPRSCLRDPDATVNIRVFTMVGLFNTSKTSVQTEAIDEVEFLVDVAELGLTGERG